MGKCPECGDYVYESIRHRCKPAFYVREDWHEDDDDHRLVHAEDMGEAAELYADHSDVSSAEYTCVGGQPMKVFVRPAIGGEWKPFTVHGEAVPSYSATEGHKP